MTGLTTAFKLVKEGFSVTVIEKSGVVGGLARSYQRNGFTYDYGPHRFHTQNEELIKLITSLLGDNLGVRDRCSRIYMDRRFFNYPLKLDNLLKNLPLSVLVRSFTDFLAVKARNLFVPTKENNFESWVLNRYGKTLYRKFFGVYTEKTWGIPCTQISADWAAQRITLISLWDAVKKTVFRPRGKNQPRTYVSRFWYPKRGGIGAICQRLAEEIERHGGQVLLNVEVTGLDAVGTRIEGIRYLVDGVMREESPESIVSTIPITTLCRMVNPTPPPEVTEKIDAMNHRSMVFVYLVLDRDRVTNDHWIYLPEDSLTVHRISEFKNFSELNAPEGKTLLCCEITCDFNDETWSASDEKLRQIAVDDLENVGLIAGHEVAEAWTHRTRFAYPIYDLDYAERLESAKAFIAQFENLFSAGRQGLFKYNNMDHSVEMGIETSLDVRHNRRETDKVASGSDYFG